MTRPRGIDCEGGTAREKKREGGKERRVAGTTRQKLKEDLRGRGRGKGEVEKRRVECLK